MRVGLDLDNTLVNYEAAFSRAAWDLGMVNVPWRGSKQELKASIHRGVGGSEMWQRLQGQVYSRYLAHARLMDGAALFLRRCRLRNIPLWIVSHKTKYGHFDEGGVPLRDEALGWLEAQGAFSEKGLGLARDRISFESTRGGKARRIGELGLTHFVDDLREVFEEDSFPEETEQVYYQKESLSEIEQDGRRTTCNAWMAIGNHLLGELREAEVLDLVNDRWPELRCTGCESVVGSGNSRINKLTRASAPPIALKNYPDRETENRDRLGVESRAYEFLRGLDVLCVPSVIHVDRTLNWAIYTWEEGKALTTPEVGDLLQAVEFLSALKTASGMEAAASLAPAFEACLSGEELVRQIYGRWESLRAATDEHVDLGDFLDQVFPPLMRQAERRARKYWPHSFYRELSFDDQTLSPGDFGFHNALHRPSKELVFFDFEYFGWDDPVKLISDFWWHPGMQLSERQKEQWLDDCLLLYGDSSEVATRLDAAHPLYGLRWALIVLNPFLRSGWGRRAHAQPDEKVKRGNVLSGQLSKAKNICQKVEAWLQVHS